MNMPNLEESEYRQPEEYHLHERLRFIPNSVFPVLVYRSVVPTSQDLTESLVRGQLEPNGWYWNGTFKAYFTHHFHSVTHECYVVIKGSSTLALGGKKRVDMGSKEGKVEVELGVGDAIVLPAGVAHSSITASPDYEYLGLYPNGAPHYDNNWCKASEEDTEKLVTTAGSVPVPLSDPIYGPTGPLMGIWKHHQTNQQLHV